MKRWLSILAYGAAIALGALALAALDYTRLVRTDLASIVIGAIALACMGLGLFVGWRLFAPAPPLPAGNPAAAATLGLSPRELAVLTELAAGHSNKQIARTLAISPNTVKTHVARLFEKLGSNRRTEAIARARELGIL